LRLFGRSAEFFRRMIKAANSRILTLICVWKYNDFSLRGGERVR
jgi:hypothetical protein